MKCRLALCGLLCACGGCVYIASLSLPLRARSSTKNVLSYSLYGSNWDRYGQGAIANAELAPILYPGWEMHIYYDSSVPVDLVGSLGRYEHVVMINVTSEGRLRNRMSWRFLAAEDSRCR